MIVSTKHDLDFYLSDPATHDAALAHLQSLMDEQYGYDDNGAWTLIGGGGLERLGLTRAEAVALGAQERAVPEPAGPDLADLKIQACSRLNSMRELIKFGVFVDSNGVRYQVDKEGRDNFTGLLTKVADGFVLPSGFEWTDADNNQVTHTTESIRSLTTDILLWSSAVHNACVCAKKAINDPLVVTAEQISAIENGVVWP